MANQPATTVHQIVTSTLVIHLHCMLSVVWQCSYVALVKLDLILSCLYTVTNVILSVTVIYFKYDNPSLGGRWL